MFRFPLQLTWDLTLYEITIPYKTTLNLTYLFTHLGLVIAAGPIFNPQPISFSIQNLNRLVGLTF